MKLRFAPSPTGFLHVGGARTAIFNLLHARRHGGTMLLRIEDTDVERSRQHHAEQIVSSLQWLGVEWDEGPVYQSDRLERYRQRAEELVASAARPIAATARSRSWRRSAPPPNARDSSGAIRASAGTLKPAPRRGEPHVIRFKVEPGPIEFHDLIRGDVHFEGELIDDFVLLRSDGYPTYHLSVVVDDIDMDITHVARGDDHLSNTPKHICSSARSAPRCPSSPTSRSSSAATRSASASAPARPRPRSIATWASCPQALFNFLTLLGWSPGGDREIFSKEEAAAHVRPLRSQQGRGDLRRRRNCCG